MTSSDAETDSKPIIIIIIIIRIDIWLVGLNNIEGLLEYLKE